jgi:hypothetical protein
MRERIKLNLGCGMNKRPGWVNVDRAAECAPDRIVDLEQFPWPFEDDVAEEALFHHSLEHLGAETDTYLGIFKELYRVCAAGAKVTIVAPHPRHDDFLGDPTHVRAVTPAGLALFSKQKNEEWAKKGNANTPLALYLGVDFEFSRANYRLASPWRERAEKGQIRQAELEEAIRSYNNVVREVETVLIVRK